MTNKVRLISSFNLILIVMLSVVIGFIRSEQNSTLYDRNDDNDTSSNVQTETVTYETTSVMTTTLYEDANETLISDTPNITTVNESSSTPSTSSEPEPSSPSSSTLPSVSTTTSVQLINSTNVTSTSMEASDSSLPPAQVTGQPRLVLLSSPPSQREVLQSTTTSTMRPTRTTASNGVSQPGNDVHGKPVTKKPSTTMSDELNAAILDAINKKLLMNISSTTASPMELSPTTQLPTIESTTSLTSPEQPEETTPVSEVTELIHTFWYAYVVDENGAPTLYLIVAIIVLITMILLIITLCVGVAIYRRRHPVRMGFGKKFSTFENPIYRKSRSNAPVVVAVHESVNRGHLGQKNSFVKHSQQHSAPPSFNYNQEVRFQRSSSERPVSSCNTLDNTFSRISVYEPNQVR